MRENENGIRRTFWLNRELDSRAEEARKALGLGRSGFYRYAVTRLLEALLVSNKSSQEGS